MGINMNSGHASLQIYDKASSKIHSYFQIDYPLEENKTNLWLNQLKFSTKEHNKHFLENYASNLLYFYSLKV